RRIGARGWIVDPDGPGVALAVEDAAVRRERERGRPREAVHDELRTDRLRARRSREHGGGEQERGRDRGRRHDEASHEWAPFGRGLRGLEDDETLLIQSGKPVGVFRTQPSAPRVLISNAMLVPKWADWETFWQLEAAGLTMYGQMTAGSWIYIGSQGILQGTYETLGELGGQRFGGSLAGRIVLTAGLGGMGGAQPLAVTMNE